MQKEKKAQITFEALLAFLIFIAVLSSISLSILNSHKKLNDASSSSYRSARLAYSSLNAGILYSSTQSVCMDMRLNPQKTNYKQNLLSTAQNEFAFTTNPGVNSYVQLDAIPN